MMQSSLFTNSSSEEGRGWSTIKLGPDIVESLSGFSCARNKLAVEGTVQLRPYNIDLRGELNLEELVYLPVNFRSDVTNYFLRTGDVLFNNTNSVELVGKSALVREPMKAAFSNHITRLRVRDLGHLDPGWLALALRALHTQGYFAAKCNRWIGQAGFSATALAETEIPLPPLATQRRIVARLDALLAEVGEARDLIRPAVEEAHLLQLRANVDVFKTVSEQYDSVPIGTTFSFRNELIHPSDGQSGELRFIGLQHIESHTGRRLGEDRLAVEQLKGRKFKFLPGDVVYGYLRPYLNKVWLADQVGYCSVDQYVLIPNLALIDRRYLAHFMRSESFLKQAMELTNTLQLPRLRSGLLSGIPIPLPPLNTQHELVAQLDNVQAHLETLRRLQAETEVELDTLKQALLAQAFRGEL